MWKNAAKQSRHIICYIIVLSSMSTIGCGTGTVDEQWKPIPKSTDVCPDASIKIRDAYLSSILGEDGTPVDRTNNFPLDSKVIYVTFVLTGEFCCTFLTVEWKYEGQHFSLWQSDGDFLINPVTVALERPDAGFPKGNYTVALYSELWGTMLSFKVE